MNNVKTSRQEIKNNAGNTMILNPRNYLPILGLALALLVPLIVKNPYYLGLINLVILFGAAGIAWNIVGGYARQVSLGHSIFFGIGAYTTTLLQIKFNISPWIGMFFGGVFAVLIGILMGMSVFRMKGHYFAVFTIAYSYVMMLLFQKFRGLTGGAEGLSVPFHDGSFAMFQFSSKVPYYYIFLMALVLIIFLVHRLGKSRIGYYWTAIGQDEQAAMAIGINIAMAKHLALGISAFLTAIFGSFYAQYVYFIEPFSMFSTHMSVEIALVAIVGGLGTVMGPVVGAIVVKPIAELTNMFLGNVLPGANYALYGLILIVAIIVIPNGLIVPINQLYQKLIKRLERSSDRS